jgi:hypothetical protein
MHVIDDDAIAIEKDGGPPVHEAHAAISAAPNARECSAHPERAR